MRQLATLALNDEGFVFDPTTGDSFQTNPTGLAILKALRDGMDDEAAAALLAEEYEVTTEDARQDVADFRAQLKSVGLA